MMLSAVMFPVVVSGVMGPVMAGLMDRHWRRGILRGCYQANRKRKH
jgi:hypothetical protein